MQSTIKEESRLNIGEADFENLEANEEVLNTCDDPMPFLDFSFFPVTRETNEVEKLICDFDFEGIVEGIEDEQSVLAQEQLSGDFKETTQVEQADINSGVADDLPVEQQLSSNLDEHEQHGNSCDLGDLIDVYPLKGSENIELPSFSLVNDCFDPMPVMNKDNTYDEKKVQRFKPHHEQKWNLRFKEFREFVKEHGHGVVPHTYPKNQQLASWVKRQRRQCKLFQEGKRSTITEDRLELLASAGFIWNAHEVSWREKMNALKNFHDKHEHCIVPTKCKKEGLGMWVKCQRRQYKLYLEGKPSSLNSQRIAELEKLGFEWEIKSVSPSDAKPDKCSILSLH